VLGLRWRSLCWLALVAVAGCGTENPLECRDLLPTGEASFARIRPLFMDGSRKSCTLCHNATSPVFGYDFEGPAATYDALTSRIAPIYEVLASGEMPEDGERWSADDLRLLRSWYCQGALYEGE
jgi:hypothetical protein